MIARHAPIPCTKVTVGMNPFRTSLSLAIDGLPAASNGLKTLTLRVRVFEFWMAMDFRKFG